VEDDTVALEQEPRADEVAGVRSTGEAIPGLEWPPLHQDQPGMGDRCLTGEVGELGWNLTTG
jgi:hypothetical protein